MDKFGLLFNFVVMAEAQKEVGMDARLDEMGQMRWEDVQTGYLEYKKSTDERRRRIAEADAEDLHKEDVERLFRDLYEMSLYGHEVARRIRERLNAKEPIEEPLDLGEFDPDVEEWRQKVQRRDELRHSLERGQDGEVAAIYCVENAIMLAKTNHKAAENWLHLAGEVNKEVGQMNQALDDLRQEGTGDLADHSREASMGVRSAKEELISLKKKTDEDLLMQLYDVMRARVTFYGIRMVRAEKADTEVDVPLEKAAADYYEAVLQYLAPRGYCQTQVDRMEREGKTFSKKRWQRIVGVVKAAEA